jgi:hypothetical protein
MFYYLFFSLNALPFSLNLCSLITLAHCLFLFRFGNGLLNGQHDGAAG